MQAAVCPNCGASLPRAVAESTVSQVVTCRGCQSMLLWGNGRVLRAIPAADRPAGRAGVPAAASDQPTGPSRVEAASATRVELKPESEPIFASPIAPPSPPAASVVAPVAVVAPVTAQPPRSTPTHAPPPMAPPDFTRKPLGALSSPRSQAPSPPLRAPLGRAVLLGRAAGTATEPKTEVASTEAGSSGAVQAPAAEIDSGWWVEESDGGSTRAGGVAPREAPSEVQVQAPNAASLLAVPPEPATQVSGDAPTRAPRPTNVGLVPPPLPGARAVTAGPEVEAPSLFDGGPTPTALVRPDRPRPVTPPTPSSGTPSSRPVELSVPIATLAASALVAPSSSSTVRTAPGVNADGIVPLTSEAITAPSVSAADGEDAAELITADKHRGAWMAAAAAALVLAGGGIWLVRSIGADPSRATVVAAAPIAAQPVAAAAHEVEPAGKVIVPVRSEKNEPAVVAAREVAGVAPTAKRATIEPAAAAAAAVARDVPPTTVAGESAAISPPEPSKGAGAPARSSSALRREARLQAAAEARRLAHERREAVAQAKRLASEKRHAAVKAKLAKAANRRHAKAARRKALAEARHRAALAKREAREAQRQAARQQAAERRRARASAGHSTPQAGPMLASAKPATGATHHGKAGKHKRGKGKRGARLRKGGASKGKPAAASKAELRRQALEVRRALRAAALQRRRAAIAAKRDAAAGPAADGANAPGVVLDYDPPGRRGKRGRRGRTAPVVTSAPVAPAPAATEPVAPQKAQPEPPASGGSPQVAEAMAVARARNSYQLGSVKLFEGDNGAAEKHYRQSLEEFPGYVAGYRGLGLVLARQGRAAEAVEAWSTYIRTVPRARDVWLVRRRLERVRRGHPELVGPAQAAAHGSTVNVNPPANGSAEGSQ